MIWKSVTYISILTLVFLTGSSCDRERQIPVPYVPVNYTVYLTNPSNYHLRVPGSHLILPDEGNLGIILYRKTMGDPDDFIALDLTCTNEPYGTCKVELDEETGFYLVCPCCGSEYSVMDGYVTKGPARWPLKEYQTAQTQNTVRIFN